MKRVAVTGCTGFVGKRFLAYNHNRFDIIPVSLRDTDIASLDLHHVSTVVHLAGKAHQMQPIEDKIYFDINYELTRKLAETAKLQGVQQFVYISSTKVYGDDIKGKLDEQSPCAPTDAYGASKLKAEQYLQAAGTATFKVAIVRPPLVYGPEVKGNMIRLLELAGKNYPLPFGRSGNARSMVFVDNLVELINTIITSQSEGVFVAGDREPIATDRLILLIRKYLGNPKGLLSIPGPLRVVLRTLRPALYTRLFGSFVVDNSATNQRLGFVPPYTTEYGIEQMVKWYQS
ncbi:MAG TPA: NAD-dependent epimerase/dehydratase family protein [Chitinophagaceae bacterium]|jgi:UDP-glucose 4-epimerase